MALLLKRELVIMKAENSVFIHIHETYLTMNINSKCLKPGSKQKWKLLQVGADTQIDNIIDTQIDNIDTQIVPAFL